MAQVVAGHLINNMTSNKVSIIIPCLNEENSIHATLLALQNLRQRGHEVILGDAGSTDNTSDIASTLCDKIIPCGKGRALQMNTAAEFSSGDILCFLHADTIAPENLDSLIIDALANNKNVWGRFNIKLSGKHWAFRLIESLINIRSCITGIASGDQGIFVSRRVFNKLHGFKLIPLMEDIELSQRLKNKSRPVCVSKSQLTTSSRRWEKHGIARTVILMWSLRLKYFLGTPTTQLEKLYRQHDK